ncbi:MAG: 3-dehydroquinate synthase [Candidatus Zixiibacteriota bacterium]
MFDTDATFSFPHSTCRIMAGSGAPETIAAFVNKIDCSSAFIVTDKNVYRHHGHLLRSLLQNIECPSAMHVIPAGEMTKSYRYQIEIHKWLLDSGADRNSVLLGAGGGVVCDLVGFAAATFMRGISHILIPTTLVAQVDAAIGGKNGINLPNAKNMIGTVKQPLSIIADPLFLSTLKREHVREGMSELVKMALVRSRKLAGLLDSFREAGTGGGDSFLPRIIEVGIRLKLEIIKRDPFESGLRKTLNFGHTTAHALEVIGSYRRRMPHGKAVAFGMLVALEMSQKLCSLSDETRIWGHDQIRSLYKSFPIADSSPEAVWEVISRDKKRVGRDIQFVLLESFAKPVLRTVNRREFSRAFMKVSKSWSK